MNVIENVTVQVRCHLFLEPPDEAHTATETDKMGHKLRAERRTTQADCVRTDSTPTTCRVTFPANHFQNQVYVTRDQRFKSLSRSKTFVSCPSGSRRFQHSDKRVRRSTIYVQRPTRSSDATCTNERSSWNGNPISQQLFKIRCFTAARIVGSQFTWPVSSGLSALMHPWCWLDRSVPFIASSAPHSTVIQRSSR